MKRGMISDKKGISVMIGYILLISMAILMSIIVYQWVKTYIPQESIECKEGVSLFIQSYNNDCTNERLDLTLKNNGRFDLAGYFIHATTESSQELAVTDLSGYTERGEGGSVLYPPSFGDINTKSTGNLLSDSFNLASIGQIFSIEVVPLRYETIKNRNRAVACSDARIKQDLICGTFGISCLIDGNVNIPAGEQCDCGGDACTPSELDNKDCTNLGFTGGTLNCYASGPNECTFDTSGCIAPMGQVYGNGIIEGSEQCDDGNSINGDGCSSPGTIDSGWSCTGTPSVCRKDIFVYLFSETNPLSDGWTSECPVGEDCGGSDTSDIYTENNADSCNIDSSCGSFYMITKDDRAAVRRIDATLYKDLILTYYRRSRAIGGTGDQIMVEWKLSTDSTWRTPVIEQTSATNLGSWAKSNQFNFPSNVNGQQINIRFWLNDGNTEHALWDSINITGAKL